MTLVHVRGPSRRSSRSISAEPTVHSKRVRGYFWLKSERHTLIRASTYMTFASSGSRSLCLDQASLYRTLVLALCKTTLDAPFCPSQHIPYARSRRLHIPYGCYTRQKRINTCPVHAGKLGSVPCLYRLGSNRLLDIPVLATEYTPVHSQLLLVSGLDRASLREALYYLHRTDELCVDHMLGVHVATRSSEDTSSTLPSLEAFWFCNVANERVVKCGGRSA